MSSVEPTAINRPSLTATASACVSFESMVAILPLMKIASAVSAASTGVTNSPIARSGVSGFSSDGIE